MPLGSRAASAASLDIRAAQGGRDIAFGAAGGKRENVEVIVDAVSNQPRQYFLTQTLIDPLRSSDGKPVAENVLFVSALQTTNRYGSLFPQNTPITSGRTTIYTSSGDGRSDSFRLLYALDASSLAPGSYRGRIAFTLQQAGSAATTVTLNVTADVRSHGTVEFRTSSGGRRLILEQGKNSHFSAEAVIETRGLGAAYRLGQWMTGPLVSAEGISLGPDDIVCQVRGSRDSSENKLGRGRDYLYASSGGDDSITIRYSLENPGIPAGTYKSMIRYFIEESGPERVIETADIEIRVPRILELKVNPGQFNAIQFVDGAPGTAKTAEVRIEVRSNVGRRYQVSQRLLSPLVGKNGLPVPDESLTIRSEETGTKGTTRLSKNERVRPEMVLFVSDQQGSSDSFKLIYELKPDLPAGEYGSNIIFSVSEL